MMVTVGVWVSASIDSCLMDWEWKDIPPICFFSSTIFGSPRLVYLNLKGGICRLPLLVGESQANLALACISRRAPSTGLNSMVERSPRCTIKSLPVLISVACRPPSKCS